MASKGSGIVISGVAMGILAIVAGVLIIWGVLPLNLVVGIYLIIFGILAVVNK
jgi:uncharacterized membrane protein HdeD (DUF308 family)